MKNKKQIKLFQILNDDFFWKRYVNICLTPSRVIQLREYRTKFTIPGKKVMKEFVKDYKILESDNRGEEEIIIELLSK